MHFQTADSQGLQLNLSEMHIIAIEITLVCDADVGPFEDCSSVLSCSQAFFEYSAEHIIPFFCWLTFYLY